MLEQLLGAIGLAARARKISFGADSVEEDVKRNKVKLVIVAEDSSQRTKDKFKRICEIHQIPIIIDWKIDELSKAIGKSNKAIIGIKDVNMANGIQKKYSGGDVIG